MTDNCACSTPTFKTQMQNGYLRVEIFFKNSLWSSIGPAS